MGSLVAGSVFCSGPRNVSTSAKRSAMWGGGLYRPMQDIQTRGASLFTRRSKSCARRCVSGSNFFDPAFLRRCSSKARCESRNPRPPSCSVATLSHPETEQVFGAVIDKANLLREMDILQLSNLAVQLDSVNHQIKNSRILYVSLSNPSKVADWKSQFVTSNVSSSPAKRRFHPKLPKSLHRLLWRGFRSRRW